MNYKLIFILFIFSANTSCKKNLYKDLQKTNMIILFCSNNKEEKTIITDKKSIQIFIDIFKKEQLSLQTTNPSKIGLIEYYYNDSLLLSVTRSPEGISYQQGGKVVSSKITYQAGMYFDQICNNKLK